jgi:hypothetical protein
MAHDERDAPANATHRDAELLYPPNLSLKVSSHRNASDLIPLEVIESWLKGEYLVGITQSTGYQYIGWSLLLRGFYEYKNNVEGEIVHWGYCYIDLKDGDLYYAGVRINSGQKWGLAEYNHPIYWRSVFSKFVGLESEAYPRLYFGYIAHLLENKPPAGDGTSYRNYAQACHGEPPRGFFEWYFKSTLGNRNLALSEENRLKDIDRFWRDACRAMNQDTLPEKPDSSGIEEFRTMVLGYLADRDRFDLDLALLEQLHPNQELLALVNLNLKTIKNGSLEAMLQPLSREIAIGSFQFTRLPQPFVD